MSEKKEDLRIRRTHKLLCDAMFALLETQSFDDISVVDICDKAMVHRATFYKHFKDKYDFMEYVTKEKLREFYHETIMGRDFSHPREAYHVMVDNVIRFVEKNKQMFILSSKSSGNSFFESIHKIIFEELSDFIKNSGIGNTNLSVPADILSQFLTGGFIALVKMWISDNNAYTKDEMALHIENLLSAINRN